MDPPPPPVSNVPLMVGSALLSGAAASVALALCVLYSVYLKMSKRRDLPPGPPRVPFLGNIHQLPQLYQHKTFMEWAAQYGDVIYAEFFTQPTIIISSVKAAYDLMEKRGAKYSNRPRFVRNIELIGWTGNIAFRQYDDGWRRHRKLLNKE
ncbi:hypothetical protein EVJ58_g256 [Rhodofomes roseus]|uniref:Cytochrome P450 n=1 Tax=Rhodofomes roseus TaxID=34475 RepID=A0A4Y9Z774_9APHY|nr:hypothetical protein EVJ58_g256 [Rhodofomes roseus]